VAANDPEDVCACVLEDLPFFSVTPEEVQEGAGAFVWFDCYLPAHEYFAQKAAERTRRARHTRRSMRSTAVSSRCSEGFGASLRPTSKSSAPSIPAST
jgi:hypothetical protein